MELGTRSGGFVFLGLLALVILVEAGWLIWRRRQAYPWKEAAASMGVAVIKRVVDAATAGIAAGVLFWVYDHRLWTLEIDSLWMGLAFFLLLELAYYWHHRWAHEIRWLWATHGVHHSPNHMNLSVAGRLGWTGLVSGSVLFFAPLALIGFHPIAIFLGLAVSLFYQIWIHTETIGRLGPLEWIFNTPAHHRVHHGSNPEYIDKNYGGVLIIYDRLFGTFAEERAPVRYGLVTPLKSNNPFVIAFFEWAAMARDVLRAESVRDIVLYLFGRPGWRPAPKRARE